MLSCGEARNLASEMLDGALSKSDEAAVKDHVASCETCPGLYRAMVAVHNRLEAMGRESISPGFASTLKLAIDKERRG